MDHPPLKVDGSQFLVFGQKHQTDRLILPVPALASAR
jgi:hypothetical protein